MNNIGHERTNNKRTSHAGKTNKLKCLGEELQQQSNKHIGHEATTNQR